jgi:hypothetical protein
VDVLVIRFLQMGRNVPRRYSSNSREVSNLLVVINVKLHVWVYVSDCFKCDIDHILTKHSIPVRIAETAVLVEYFIGYILL